MKNQKKENPPALVLRRFIHAKRDKVFDAWTKPELMKEWFYPGKGTAEVTNNLTVNGAFTNKMLIADSVACTDSSADVKAHLHTGEYLEIVPPEKIVFTWTSALVTNSRVTVELREAGEDTELILTHELLDTVDLREKHQGGWEGCLLNLVGYFSKQ